MLNIAPHPFVFADLSILDVESVGRSINQMEGYHPNESMQENYYTRKREPLFFGGSENKRA